MKARAAILVESHKPLVVDEIALPDKLEAGQVLVKVEYTTICGAQLNEIDAVKGPDKFLPHLLGHEGVGEVVEIGEGVSHAKPGDTVVLHWRPGTGIEAKPAKYGSYTKTWQFNAGRVTTFQDYAVVSENRVTVIPSEFDRKLAPLLGCAVTTAWGVVCNDARVKIGDSVLIFGAGGVGLPIIKFAAMAGAYPVVVVESDPAKREKAEAFGAHYVYPPDDAVLAGLDMIRAIGGGSFDVVIDTAGTVATREQAERFTRAEGVCVGVGVVHGKTVLDWMSLVEGKRLIQSKGGGVLPQRDIRKIIDLIEARKLSLSRIITHELPLDEINAGIDLMRSGSCGRVLIRP